MSDDAPKDAAWAKIYAKAPPSTRTGIFYNTFPFPTKIAPETVAVYIAAHTKPGDTVLDVFGGSGSTGLAALMCEYPTADMRRLAAGLGLEPTWGARNAVVYELGKYGAFATKVMADPPDWREFEDAVDRLVKDVSADLPGVYDVPDPFGGVGTVRHVIHSDVVSCPKCGRRLPWYSVMVRREPLGIDGRGLCPFCGHEGRSSDFGYELQTVYDPLLGTEVTRRLRVPVRVYGRTGSVNWFREADEGDRRLAEAAEALDYPAGTEPKEIVWG